MAMREQTWEGPGLWGAASHPPSSSTSIRTQCTVSLDERAIAALTFRDRASTFSCITVLLVSYLLIKEDTVPRDAPAAVCRATPLPRIAVDAVP